MNYYNNIKNELINNEINKRVKNYSINRRDLNTYYKVGKILSEAGKHYGEGIIKEYSRRLTNELGKGYTQSRLRYFRRFYYIFSKCPTVSDKLSFSHYWEGIIKEYSKRLTSDLNKKYDISSLNKMKKFYNLIEKVATLSPYLSYGHYVELLPYEDINKVKNYSKERHRVITYFEIGKLLTEAGNKYGDNIVEEYAKKLVKEIGKKFNKRTLFRMKQFYKIFSDKKVSPLATQLTWSHYTELLSIKDVNEIKYYIEISVNNVLSKRGLREKIKSREYDRLSNKAKEKLKNNEKIEIDDIIPNPIIINNNDNIEMFSEKSLHQLIIDNIEQFMRKLGIGFCFIGSEYKIKIGDTYNYIDLLLFNYEYNCFVVIELKVTELKKEHIGQIQVYMNYIDDNLKSINHNKTIGIIICKEDNEYIIKYCSDERIIARRFEFK